MRDLIFQVIGRQKGLVSRIVLSIFIVTLSEAGLLFLLNPLLKGFFNRQEAMLQVSTWFPERIHAFLPTGLLGLSFSSAQIYLALPLSLILLALIRSLGDFVYLNSQNALALELASEMRQGLFQALLSWPYLKLQAKSPAKLMSVIMNDVVMLQNRFAELMGSILRDLVLCLSCVLVLFVIQPSLALALLILCPPILWSLGKVSHRIAGYTEEQQDHLASMAAKCLDIRERFLFIRAQAGEQLEAKHFASFSAAYLRLTKNSFLLRALFAPGLEFMGFGIFAGIIYGIRTLGIFAAIGPEELLQTLAVLGLLLKPLKTLGEQWTRWQETRGSLAEPLHWLQESQVIKVGPFPLPGAEGPAEASDQNLLIKKLSFGYPGEKADSLVSVNDLDLGSKTSHLALIGSSGAGKSTLLKGLAGLIEPSAWEANLPYASARQKIYWVSQTPYLFSASIRENLCYGIKASPPPDEELENILLRLGLDAGPDGDFFLDRPLRTLGLDLSGGQIQRLCLARAFLRSEPILLLDEITAALDAQTEAQVWDSLFSLAAERSKQLVTVTHRLHNLGRFDRVMWLEEGRVRWQGSYQNLIELREFRDFQCGMSTL